MLTRLESIAVKVKLIGFVMCICILLACQYAMFGCYHTCNNISTGFGYCASAICGVLFCSLSPCRGQFFFIFFNIDKVSKMYF